MNTQSNNWTLRDIWDILLENIWIYVVSCAVAVAIAVAYIIITPPQYERLASVLIKDDEQGQSIGASQGFENLGLLKSSTNINNEIKMLKTTAFMVEVVDRLDLGSTYTHQKSGFRKVDLYKRTPFTVKADSLMQGVEFGFNIKFTTSATFVITDFVINGGDVDDLSKTEHKFEEAIKTPYGSIMVSPTPFFMTQSVAGEEFLFSKVTSKNMARLYSSRLKVALSSEATSIVDISITDESPERAENILNTLISVYNENWIKDKNEVTFNTSGFIDGRLVVIQQELESVDGSIAEFKSDKLMPDVVSVAGIQLQQTTQNNTEQLAIQNQLSMARYIQGYLAKSSANEQLLPVNTGIASGAIETQIGRYNELLLQKNLLMANSSEDNPLVADMITNLNAIKDVINISIKDLISTLSIQLSNLQKEAKQNIENLSSTPKQAKELLGVERQQKIKEQLFLYLLQKREENELSQAFSAYNTKVLSVADGSPYPKEPKKSMILMFALALGVILPSLYIIIKEAFDTLVKTKKDLEGLNIPYVGSIPFVPTQKSKSLLSVISAGNRDSGNEAFRVLRTNLDFIVDGSKSGAQIVQIISLVPSSGKSFISANLALSMSLKDTKVLVIDCDLRKKTLSNYIAKDKSHGLSDYLSGKRDSVEELIVNGALSENLDVLPVGTTPPNPSELLLKPRFAELINTMKMRYDYIFIDCPPVEIVPDAAIVGKFCDTAIFVIRAENIDKRLLPEIEAVYESKKYNNMCMVLNGVKSRGNGYGYYGNKRYGYYGYGYGAESGEANKA
ncbi:MAG: polysaccharide biosynthesis tyrosine autokinase [Rikenellaceae bacterium]